MIFNMDHLPRTPWINIDPPRELHPEKKEVPFIEKRADIKRIKNLSDQIKGEFDFDNLIIVGHGGSITTFKGITSSIIIYKKTPRVFFVDTVDENWMRYVKKSADKKNSLLLIISKSGKTITILEAMSFFSGYKTAVVTQKQESPLRRTALKNNWWVLDHTPQIDGRFSGGFETALFPIFLSDLDVNLYEKSLRWSYKKWFSPESGLYEISWRYYLWEKTGRDILYVPIYSKGLSGFSSLITQLIHESTGKEGRGMITLVSEGPECQHHTNQRIFGGRDNISSMIFIPEEDGPMRWEAEGVMGAFEKRSIPFMEVVFNKIDEGLLGRFVAFWHIFTLYSALFRGLNPFGQEEVELQKKISRDIRREKGVLKYVGL